MNNLKKILLKTRNLPFNLDKPLSDLLMLLGFIAVNGQENNIVGELYLTAEPSDKAFSICGADFRALNGISFSAVCELETKAERGEWARCAKIAMLLVLKQAFEVSEPSWGVLTGVRPGKLANKILFSGEDPEKVLVEKYLLASSNAKLISDIAKKQNSILTKNVRDIAVYIGVPYCPSRCLYCSFPAGIMPADDEFQQNFCNSVEDDIRAVVQLISMYGLRIKSLYIGGGTPTSLKDAFFQKLMNIVSNNFSIDLIDEFTVEAGRPDCLNAEKKLRAMEEAGVNRISINPQTMHDRTLVTIGRQHTVKQIYEAFTAIRKCNIPVVNMDLIVGLPQERIIDIKYSLDKMLDFYPENLTVHTLALKKTSPLFQICNDFEFISAVEASQVFDYASLVAEKLGMSPYYLYRQHYMLGNLANIGYAKQGTECIYNMQMMEEQYTVIGIGPSSATKVPASDGHHLYKFHMPKNFYDYKTNAKQLFAKRAETIALRYEQEE
ncbi:MAG: coproporphyrinogen dehydrogenase HemZ [Acidaminococcaceae bacterium]|nr:coproporphyrinogen dehydrogenase HemZ [Acidaminococcaceae bacterium]